MSEQENTEVVRKLFEAFGSGDVPAMLGLIADDVKWTILGPSSVSYYGDRVGHEGVVEFLTQLGSNVEFEKFEPLEFITSGDKVIVTGSERGRVRATGKIFDNDWAMIYILKDGLITSFRCYEDTAAVAEAYR
ncbi:MAG: nuclear transport factor 2 family protein [Pyrinomonadaceae bacterium]